MLNRHGLVAGATGTGKTKTLPLLDLADLRAVGKVVGIHHQPAQLERGPSKS